MGMPLRGDETGSHLGMDMTLRHSLLILPALAAMIYPWLLSALTMALRSLGVAAPPAANIVGGSPVVILLAAWSVMAAGAFLALKLGQGQGGTRLRVRSRLLAHLAFAAPSFLVGFGNVAGILNQR